MRNKINIFKNSFFVFTTICLLFLISQEAFAYLATDYVELEVTYKKDNGQTCSIGTDCISNNCVDGFCCNTSCTGTCESCALSGDEGICTTRSEGDNNECSGCYYCDGSNTTCQYVSEDTDPYGDCDSTCASVCIDRTGYCDGAGGCKTTNCAPETACSGTSCDGANLCNAAFASCSCIGDDCYDDSGNDWSCQAQCDGSSNCDYSVNCSEIFPPQTQTRIEGTFGFTNVDFNFE